MRHLKGKMVIVGSFLLLAVGCVATKESDYTPISPASMAPAQFRWPVESEGKKIGIGIGIVRPSYEPTVNLDASCPTPPWEGNVRQLAETTLGDLPVALEKDIEKALDAKGLFLTGKFSSLKSMTYAEKEKSNLVLFPRIDFTVKCQPPMSRPIVWRHTPGDENPSQPLRIMLLTSGQKEFMAAPKVEADGKVFVSGSIQLRILEPLTSETLWVKDLEFPAQEASFAFYYWVENVTDAKGNITSSTRHVLPEYDTRADALVRAFEKIYSQLYDGFKAYFSKEEMAQVKLDADKVRKLKRY